MTDQTNGHCKDQQDGCLEHRLLAEEVSTERKLNKAMFKRVDSLEAKFWTIIIMQVGVLGSIATGVILLLLKG